MAHNNVTLELRKDKPDNVWRYIYAWQQLPSGHGNGISYLLLHALVQWGELRDVPQNIFCILVQYSTKIGENVDVAQPAHILEIDAENVAKAYNIFVKERVGRR